MSFYFQGKKITDQINRPEKIFLIIMVHHIMLCIWCIKISGLNKSNFYYSSNQMICIVSFRIPLKIECVSFIMVFFLKKNSHSNFHRAYQNINLHSGPENIKSPGKKLVKSNKSHFFSWNCNFKYWFLSIFEIAKNGIWSKKFFMKLIYLISRVFGLDFFKIF